MIALFQVSEFQWCVMVAQKAKDGQVWREMRVGTQDLSLYS